MRFVDSSFWFAYQQPSDPHHAQAVAIARTATRRLVTTNHVLGETWTLTRRRRGHRMAVGFLDRVADLRATGRLEVVVVDERTEADAIAWLRRHDEREYSYVDATSFAVMRKRRIREALAFDGDFAAAGFIELRP